MISAVLFDGDTKFNTSIRKKLSNQNKVKLLTTTRDFSELETMFTKNRVDVLIFGPSIENDDMTSFSEFISSKYPHVGIILISSKVTTDLLRDALRTGARDVLPVSASGKQLRQAIEMAHRQSLRVRKAVKDLWPENSTAEADAEHSANIITFFGAKGGVGTTFVATNVAVSLAQQTKSDVILLDIDLQFGDVAVMLQLEPSHTISDAVSALDRLDTEMMRGFLSTHTSGLKALLAPVMPDKADSISSGDISYIINVLKGMCDYLIIDTPACLDDRVLTALDNSDEICLVTSLDVPSLKNTKLTLNMLEALQYRRENIKLVLNRANSKVKLGAKEVEHSLKKKAVVAIPSNIIVPLSVNRGIPIVIDAPKTPIARNISQFVDALGDGSEAPVVRTKHRIFTDQ